MVIQNTLEFCIMHYLKILVTKHLLIPYGLNELKYKRIPKDKTPLNLLYGQLGHTGAQSRGPLVKSEFFFFCVFSRYLWNEDSSVDPTLILLYSAPGLFIAQSIFRELLSDFSNVGSIRYVTSRHVMTRHVTSRHVS